MNRTVIAKFRMLLAGCALGAVTAWIAVHFLRLREGRAELTHYAWVLERAKEDFNRESIKAIADVTQDGFPVCSDKDIAYMRSYVFVSPHVRDIGRIKDKKLYCTSGVGRLDEPTLPPPNQEIFESDGVKIMPRAPLAFSPDATGFIIRKGSVSLVLNPDSFAYLNDPPMFYSAPLLDREHGKLVTAFGPMTPVTEQEAIAGKLVERDGFDYMPICAEKAMMCVVAGVPRAAMLRQNQPLAVVAVVTGALFGVAIGFLILEFYRGRDSMESQLRRALRKELLTVSYQPIVKLETGEVVAAEALVRWVGEDGTEVRPEVFVGLAEERGFGMEITQLVVRRTLEEMGDLMASCGLRVSLNIAAHDLTQPGFFAELGASLARAGVPASSMGLELTERSTADHTVALEGLAQLKEAGHMVYIDDFGTGYSSLAYLHRLAVTGIKVDQAFTQTVGTGAVTASVLPQIMDMAAKLRLLVVVEGIETEEQAEYFRAAGNGILGQGWLFGKPLPAAEFREFHAANDASRPAKD